MENPFLTVHAQVKMQSENLLRLVVFSPERAEYQCSGFRQPVVKVVDYRPASVDAMAQALKSGNRAGFLDRFNRPAQVSLWASYPREIRIELRETTRTAPAYTLQIGQGPRLALPLYPYLFRHSAPSNIGGSAMLFLYQCPQTEETPVPALSMAE